MKAIFVTTQLIGSKIIRYGTGENISHCAFSFNGDDLIYHATESSIHQTPSAEFFGHYTVLDTVVMPCDVSDEKKIRDIFVNSIGYQKYDWKMMFYFAVDRIRVKFLKMKPMATNPMNDQDNMDCVEVAYIVDECYFKVTRKKLLPDDINLSVTTPGQLRAVLKERFPV